jgi:hypothetical protein
MEHDVTKPIRRWVKVQNGKTKELLRYDVKYERLPNFCFYCGIVGHVERGCMLPEEEKIVRYCVEQRASPFKSSDHRSYYIHAEPAMVKRHLQFYSSPSSGWKLRPQSESDANLLMEAVAAEDVAGGGSDEENTVTAPQHEVLDVVAAVDRLTVGEGGSNYGNGKLTANQVTQAVQEIKMKSGWVQRYQKGHAGKRRPDGSRAQAALRAAARPSPMRVPRIEDCLREDGSLLQELWEETAARTASAFMKEKKRVLGKRLVDQDMLMMESSPSSKRSHGEVVHGQATSREDGGAKEAASPGAAGQLTGAEERTCQEP